MCIRVQKYYGFNKPTRVFFFFFRIVATSWDTLKLIPPIEVFNVVTYYSGADSGFINVGCKRIVE